MSVMPILKAWDASSKILTKPAMRVRDFDQALHDLLDDMVETMWSETGVGLAAPQVGAHLRVAIIDEHDNPQNPALGWRRCELINPEIIKAKGTVLSREGCLSLPGITAVVKRAAYIVVRAQDRHGKEFRIKAYGDLACVMQHEIDHLLGILMTDKAEGKLEVRV